MPAFQSYAFDPPREQPRRAVEQLPGRIDGDCIVVVRVPGVSVGRVTGRCPEVAFAAYLPRPGPEETLPRHSGQRLSKRRRLQTGNGGDLLGEEAPVQGN